MERLLPWLRRTGWAYLAVALTLAGLAWWSSRPRGEAVVGSRAAPPAARIVRAAPPPLLVHVAGEVRRPGVYRLGSDARVAEAVRRAGGATRRAELSGINLAAKVEDGQQVLVPRRAPAGGAGAAPGQAPAGPVSLSSATAEQLDALDGIGPTLAARIVEWRAQHGGFARVDQLMDVPGFGQGRLDALRPHIVP